VWRSLTSWLLGIDRGAIADGTGVRLELANPPSGRLMAFLALGAVLALVWVYWRERPSRRRIRRVVLWVMMGLLGVLALVVLVKPFEVPEQLRPSPAYVIVFFAAAALGLVAFLYHLEKGTATRRRKLALAAVRGLLVLVVVVVLFKPILAVDRSELKEAYVVVLLDDSLSMRLRDRYRDPKVRLALARAAGLTGPQARVLSGSEEAALDAMTRADLVNRVIANPSINLLGSLRKQCKVRVATFADTVRGVGPETWRRERVADTPPLVAPSGHRTLLGAALREMAGALRGHRVAAAIVVTDGRTQDVDPGVVDVARRLAAAHGEAFPVFTVGVGDIDESTDIEIVKVLAPSAARKDDQVTFNAVVASKGFEGEVDVLLKANGELVHTRRVRLEGGDVPQTVPIRYTPETTGSVRFTVAIPAQPDELSSENNAADHVLTVKDAKTKVLLAAGRPSYSYRYLKNALLVDQSVNLSCFLQSADADFHQEGNTRITHYPESRPELYEFDVVVLCDADPSGFREEQLKDLQSFVGQFGGGLIVMAGTLHPLDAWRRTPLEALLPVVLGGSAPTTDLLTTRTLKDAFKIRLTEQGRTHGILRLADTREESDTVWEGFPGSYWYHPVSRAKPGAVVLGEHPYDRDERGAMPLLVVGRFDPGRVLYCALDDTWRWRFWAGDVHFNRFWVQAINYVGSYRILGGSRRIQLATDKRTYAVGQRVVVQAQCLDDAFQPSQAESLEARLEMHGAEAQTVRLLPSRQGPGIFEAAFVVRSPGTGVLTLAHGGDSESLSFTVRLPESEFQHPTMDARTLTEVAQVTRGDFLRLHAADRLLERVHAAGQEITTQVQDPVFDAPIVVILFLGLACGEWWFRKRGMLA